MATKLDIVKLALAHLGEEGPSSLSDDPPAPKVRKVLVQYDQALAAALSRHPWLCALEREIISREEGARGDWKHAYVYLLPAGALRIFDVKDGDDFAWERGTYVEPEGAVRMCIRTSRADALRVAFTRVVPPEAMTPLLADAFALELAARSAGPVDGDHPKARELMNRALEAYAAAVGSEANETGGDDPVLYSQYAAVRASAW